MPRSDESNKPKPKRSLGASAAVRQELGTEAISKLNALLPLSPSAGPLAVTAELAHIAGAMAVAITVPLVGPALATIDIGVHGRYIANLMHEGQHVCLSPNTTMNKVLAHLCAFLTGNSFSSYKVEHRIHHHSLGEDDDPKVESYISKGVTDITTPWNKRRLAKVLVFDACPKSVLASFCGFFSRKSDESAKERLTRIGMWTGLSMVGVAMGGLVPVATFLTAMIILKPIVNALSDIANHAGLIPFQTDPILQTRAFTGGPVTRYVFGGYVDDLYHPVHHLCPMIPFTAKKSAWDIIQADVVRGSEIPVCNGFIYSRSSGTPSVMDDIVNRLNAQHERYLGGDQQATSRRPPPTAP